jgi:hypothetical protein
MKTRAKFRCIETRRQVLKGAWGLVGEVDAVYVVFNALMGPENEEWSKWTPSGQLSMNITNPALLDAFQPGKDYFIDISEAT